MDDKMNTTKFLCKYFSETDDHERVTMASIISGCICRIVLFCFVMFIIACISTLPYVIYLYYTNNIDPDNIVLGALSIIGFCLWFFIIIFIIIEAWEWMCNKVIVTCPKDKE